MTARNTSGTVTDQHTIVCSLCQRGEFCQTSAMLAMLKAADQARRFFVVVPDYQGDIPDDEEFD